MKFRWLRGRASRPDGNTVILLQIKDYLEKMMEKLMAQMTDLTNAVTALTGEVAGDTELMTKTVAVLDEMHTQLGAIGQAPDLSAVTTQVAAAQGALAASRQSLADAIARDAPAAAAPAAAAPAAAAEPVAGTDTVAGAATDTVTGGAA